jgi:membrane protein involved in colicin uptake
VCAWNHLKHSLSLRKASVLAGEDHVTQAAVAAVQAAEQEAATEAAAQAAKRAKKAAFDAAYDTGGAKAVDDTVMGGLGSSSDEDMENVEGGEGSDKAKKRGKGWARYAVTHGCHSHRLLLPTCTCTVL